MQQICTYIYAFPGRHGKSIIRHMASISEHHHHHHTLEESAMTTNPNAPKPGHAAIVTFGRPITDEDLRKLQAENDGVDVSLAPIDIDSEHVHTITE
jgi:hypothetical protein